MPREPEKIIQSCIKVVSSRDALVNSSLAEAAAKALIQNYHSATGNIDINLSSRKKKAYSNVWDTFAGRRHLQKSLLQTLQFHAC